ncbi:hypothetical protein FHS52_002497 [Erythromicrobium ramosum]|uniref:DUF3089 domain-containing protein n=1 Tax=Erythrobacter ramosus TaxID=35811 RepID=A0A6I4UM41_9SPHN|nr:DUF3089 domain-containing protein [Erythrobacter ramosus]MBB3776528.1 hypothetical protein [Erythrobacter ramosus]MXP38395.1 DUF3089 domain-containing protein [Erythrobacter ramosus]
MVRKFLYFVAFCIVLVISGAIILALFPNELTRLATVPTAPFVPVKPMDANAYESPALWYSRPGIGVNDPARWQPAYAADAIPINASPPPQPKAQRAFAVFFIHPTSYVNRNSWNAPLENGGDPEAERIARVYLRGMASPFNAATEIWAPRYRQATMGAFLTDAPQGRQAIDAAYADVREAYRFFLSSVDPATPIVLAGHSQGALHLKRLLAEEVKGSPVAARLVAAYLIGWPVSMTHDLPTIGFPACAAPGQIGCIISWSSFAEPADPAPVLNAYGSTLALDGKAPGKDPMLCSNPLTGRIGGKAPASANLGTLVPEDSMEKGELRPGFVPASCDPRGLMLIGSPPEMGSYVLPGNNYHVYDLPLFWANTKADVIARAGAWKAP